MYSLERWSSTSQPVVLVGSVAAVVSAVTNVCFEYALRVVAFKVVGLTRDLAAGFRFVRVVIAVGRPVTVPRLRYTDARLLTPKLFFRVTLIRRQRS